MEELFADVGSAQGLSADRAGVGCLRRKPIAICASQTNSMAVKRLVEEVSFAATASQSAREGNSPARGHHCLPCKLNTALLYITGQVLLHAGSRGFGSK